MTAGRPPSLEHAARATVLAVLFAAAIMVCAAFMLQPRTADAAADPVLGETVVFRVVDWSTDAFETYSLAATARYVGAECVIYVQKARPVPDAFVDGLGQLFDSQVYPRLTAVLGDEPRPGVDGQGRIVILLYDFGDARVDGYFYPRDIDPQSADDPYSNHREMISLNLESSVPDVESAGATAAHELAHLILYYRDYMLDPSPKRQYEGNEARWVEESVAMYAELAAGFPGNGADQLISFGSTPNENLLVWRGWMNEYGASYALGAYLAERFGASFITGLVSQPLDGVAGIEAVLEARGAFDTFDSLFGDWVVANALEGRPPETPPLAYATLDFCGELAAVAGPLPRVGTVSVESYGAVYLDLPPTDPTSIARVVVDGEDGAPLRAALLSWDSAGLLAPTVTPVPLAATTAGGTAVSPPGYDRHTLAVWALSRGVLDSSFDLRYSLTVDPATEIQFLDVGCEHQFFAFIDDLLTRGVISGKETPAGSGLWYFGSDDSVLRAQFAKMAVEAAGLHTDPVEHLDTRTFPDVPPRFDGSGAPLPYPFDYVEEAAAAGIVTGYADGRFGPWEPIRRVHLARMILRAAAAAGQAFTPYSGSEKVFADVPPGDPLYVDVMTAYTNGILDGKVDRAGARRFAPWDPATRGQVAKMTANLIWGLGEPPGED